MIKLSAPQARALRAAYDGALVQLYIGDVILLTLGRHGSVIESRVPRSTVESLLEQGLVERTETPSPRYAGTMIYATRAGGARLGEAGY
jgi:hypothetical protein